MTDPAPHASGLLDGETLDALRLRLAPLVAANAGFDGWSALALDRAAEQAGVDREVAALAFDGGAMVMIEAWFRTIDAVVDDELGDNALDGVNIRTRITKLVTARLTQLHPHREALRRAQAILAMPTHIAGATKLGWHAADVMWRLAGDTAADYNHYTKRATLGAVYAATLLTFVNDESEDFADTRAFLARRIEGIMRFEKAKARLTANADLHFSPARFLGRLRYRSR